MRRWLGRLGLLLVTLAVVLDLALLAAGDPAALPGPLAEAAADHVLPWAQDSILPLAQAMGLVRPLEADVAAAAEDGATAASAGTDPSPVTQPVATAIPATALAPSAKPGGAGPAPSTWATPAAIATKAPTALPVRIGAAVIGLDAPVVEVGVDESGAMGTPRTSWQAGWYGPRPGEPGNALFAGHVDWVTKGKAVKGSFYSLSKLKTGDVVTVAAADGSTTHFRVQWNRYYQASAAPVDEIAGPTSEPSITLITCGGDFDRALKSYLGRWVVRATIVSD